RYREAVLAEQRQLTAAGARSPAIGGPAGPALAERVESSLEALQDATPARVLRAQAEGARLETRPWTGVVVALAGAVGLAWLAADVRARGLAPAGRRGGGPDDAQVGAAGADHPALVRSPAAPRQPDPRHLPAARGPAAAAAPAGGPRAAGEPGDRGATPAGRG